MSKTVQLDPAEWKSLVLNSVVQLHTALGGLYAPDRDALGVINNHIDRIHSFVQAWHLSKFVPTVSEDEAKQYEAMGEEKDALIVPQPRKRGRPKGSTKKNGEVHP